MSSGDAHAWNRLERDLDYYKREVNRSGAEAVRAREEASLAGREARQARAMLKLIREVYRLGDFGGAEADVEQVVLGLVIENAMCDRAMLLSAAPDAGHQFRVVCALGGDGSQRVGSAITLKHPPRFCFTTGESRREGHSAQMCGLIGVPYVLWSHDPGGGFAILLGNQQESNASRPFEAADQELVETALSVYLDIRHRKREARRLERALAAAGQVDDDEEGQAAAITSDSSGIEENEIQEQLRKGGRLTGFLVVDRTAGNGPEFVGYARGSWTSSYRLLRTFRGRSDRAYKDVSRLIHLARFDFSYTPPIAVYAVGAPELRRFSGIRPCDLSPYGERQPFGLGDPQRAGSEASAPTSA